MVPKFFRTNGFNKPDKKNPSILVQDVGPDDFDLNECWSGRSSSSAPHYRVSYPEKKAPSGPSWGPRFTTLSSNVLSASTAVTKQLRIRESTRWAISRLRKSTVETSPTLARAASMPEQHLFSESNLDDYYDSDDQPEDEDGDYLETDKRSKLQYSWTQYM
ncbi:hypothetical protein V7S43_001063 [Phytophthora oleae]|uniref:AGC-kinase C-terminal domain-containing protein n=1 Tax=Phytophthora oleae TaxID=2107226 RepID=A0ABD3G3Y1_9STRA